MCFSSLTKVLINVTQLVSLDNLSYAEEEEEEEDRLQMLSKELTTVTMVKVYI